MRLFQTTDVIPGGAGSVWVGEYIQGEQHKFHGTATDADDNPIDITAYTVSAKALYYMGEAEGSVAEGNFSISESSVVLHDPPITPKNLVVDVLDQSTHRGRFDILIPNDLYTNTIVPLIAARPIVAIFITIEDGQTIPEIQKERINLVVFFGG